MIANPSYQTSRALLGSLLILATAGIAAAQDSGEDCNANGMDDTIDLLEGTSADENGNGIPDECECPGDLDLDGDTDVDDLVLVILDWGCVGLCPGDTDGNQIVNVDDLVNVLLGWGPCPVIGVCPPPSLTAWDDMAQGPWQDTTPDNFADLDGDRDVDEDDVAILESMFSGPGIPAEGAFTDLGFFTPVPADFDGDGDVDDEDFNRMLQQFTGPLVATDFLVSGSSVAGPHGLPTQLHYELNDTTFRINGLLDDPSLPDLQWEFLDFGGPLVHLTRHDLPIPLPLGAPELFPALAEHGFTPPEVELIIELAGPQTVTGLIESFVDLTQPTTGQVRGVCSGVVQDVTPAVELGLRISTVLFDNGLSMTSVVSVGCPGECYTKIVNCPPCVCNGCSYTFGAVGVWMPGTFVWEVIEGADKTDPDGGAGPVFTTTFVDKSDEKNDITIRVIYTDPNGNACIDLCETTSVDLTVTYDDPGDLVHSADPQIIDGELCHGGSTGTVNGIDGDVENVRINTDPPCEECCENIKVGFIQNVIDNSDTSTYSGGGSVTYTLPTLPILDAVPTVDDTPWYPYPRGDTTSCGNACNDPFDLSIQDTPGGCIPLCLGIPAQALTNFSRHVEFRTWLVAECPKDSRNYKALHQWDWEIDYDVDVSGVDCSVSPPTADPPAAGSGTATNTANTDAPDFGNAVTGGATANDAVTCTPAGF